MAKNLSDVWRYLAAMDLDREALDEFEAFFEAADGVPGPADGQIDAEEWQELQQSPDFNEFLSKFGDVPGLSPSARKTQTGLSTGSIMPRSEASMASMCAMPKPKST